MDNEEPLCSNCVYGCMETATLSKKNIEKAMAELEKIILEDTLLIDTRFKERIEKLLNNKRKDSLV